MSEYIAASAAVLMVPSIKGFKQKLNTALKTVEASVEVGAKLQSGALAEMAAKLQAFKETMERDSIRLDVDVDTDRGERQLRQFGENSERMLRKFKRGLIFNVVVLGMSALPTLGLALASLNTSIVELSQSLLLLPGIVSGVSASLATLVIGASGLGAAFSAASDATKDAAKSAADMDDAYRAVTQASNDLKRATRDARRELEDIHDEMRDAPLDEAEALLDLADAQAEVANTAGKSARDRQRDLIALERAESNVAKTRRDNLRLFEDGNEILAKGVEDSDKVTAAQDRLIDAMDRLAEESNSNPFFEAMKNLSPNAQDFVNQVRTMGDAWRDFRFSVQDSLFDGLGQDAVNFGNTLIPALQDDFDGLASAWNGTISEIMSVFSDGESVGLIEKIFGNTEAAQNIFTTAIDPMVDAFLKLAEIGSRYLPQLATAFGDVMQRFENFIETADKDGSMDTWIQKGMQALVDLGNSLINIGDIMGSVSEAFTGSGGRGFLESLATGTERLAAFLNTTEGQDQLRTFFFEAREELDKWLPTLKEIPGFIDGVIEACQTWSDMVMPIFRGIFDFLSTFPGVLQAILVGFLAWQGISLTLRLVAVGMTAVTNAALLGKIAMGTATGAGLTGRMAAFAALMSPGGLVMVGLTAVAGYLLYDYLNAQQEAAEAAQDHADSVRNLRTELDKLSGSLTIVGLQNKLERASAYEDINEGDGQPRDLPKLAEKIGVSRDLFTQALVPTNQAARDEVDDRTSQVLLEALNNQNFQSSWSTAAWKALNAYNQSHPDKPITKELLAAALNGDSEALDTFRNAQEVAGLPSLSDILYGGNGVPGLGENAEIAANVNKFIDTDTTDALDVGSAVRETNESLFGRAELNERGQALFGQYGSAQPYFESGDHSAGIRLDTKLQDLPKQLVTDIKNNGGSIEELADGVIIHLDADRASQYVVPALATGGMLRGPGNGTSDSILARVSDGEFVTRASQVSRNPGLFHALNSGAIDPASIPAFAPGGLINLPLGPLVPDVGGGDSPVYPAGPALQSVADQVPGITPDTGFWENAFGFRYIGDTRTATLDVETGTRPSIIPNPQHESGRGMNGRRPTHTTPHVNTSGFADVAALSSSVIPVGQSPQNTVGAVTAPSVPAGLSYDSATFNRFLNMARNGNGVNFSSLLSAVQDGGAIWYSQSDKDAVLAVGEFLETGQMPTAPGSGVSTSTSTSSSSTPAVVIPGVTVPAVTPGIDGDAGAVGPNVVPTDPANIAPDLFSPENTSPGLNNPTAALRDHLSSNFLGLGPGAAPATAPSSLPGLDGNFANLPDNLQPQNILQDFLEILVDAVFGFLGLDSYYLDMVKSAFGWNPEDAQNAESAVPEVDTILNNRAISDDALAGVFSGDPEMAAFAPASLSSARASAMAEFMAGKPYVWGGDELDGTDCSGLVMYVADAYLGREFEGRDGGTGNFAETLPARGAIIITDPSEAPPGTLRIGWSAGHAAGTLPDGRNFESSTYGQPIAVGPGASGYNDPNFDHWAYFPAGFAGGGRLRGPGSGTSDSILARVSNGEFITRASQVAKNPGLFHGLNSGAIDPASLPMFSDGGDVGFDGKRMMKAGISAAPAAPRVATPKASSDRRGDVDAAPAPNANASNPGFMGAIDGVATAAGNAASVAASIGTMGMSAAASGGVGSLISGATQIGSQVAKGILNVGSSLLVGTTTPGTTAGAYGTPMLPQQNGQAPNGPRIVNNYGDIHTASYERFYKDQQRREAQQQAPFVTSIG